MRLLSTAYDAEVAGTTTGDVLEVNAWRGGALLAASLDVTAWSLGWDANRQVQGQGSFTVADPVGALAPWGLSDALAPGGSRLQVTWVSGLSGVRIPLGWWRIRKAEPSESWRLLPTTTPTATVSPTPAHTNLAPNPDAEAFGALVTIGTNAVLNPSLETGVTGWQVAAGSTLLRVNTDAWAGSWCLQVTTTAVNSGVSIQVAQVGTNPYAAAACTVSAYVKATAGRIITIRAEEYTPPSTSIGQTVATFTATGNWQRVQVTRPNIASGNAVRPSILQNVVGVFLVDAAQIEYGMTAPTAYFDGATAAAGDFSYTWTGTAHASTSSRRAAGVTGVAAYSGGNGVRWSSTAERARSSRSFAVTRLTGGTGFIWNVPTPVTIGHWVTIRAKVKAAAGVTYQVMARTQNGGSAGLVNYTGTGAWQDVYATAQNAAALASPLIGAQIVLTSAGATLYVDETTVVVEPAAYTGPYFDGRTPDTADTTYAWTGTPDASTSTQSPKLLTYASVVLRLPGGGQVEVSADEETATALMNRLDAEVAVQGHVLAEVTRLLRDVCPVKVLPGVVDGDVPAALVYGDSRMDAVEDLLDVIAATHRMAGDGSLEILPAGGIGPVWTVAGGDEGVLVELSRALSDEAIYNAVVSNNETEDGQPLLGRAYLTYGALAWGGPFGKVPLFHKAIGTTPQAVLADATTTLANRQASGEVDLAVTCLAHPGVQPNDRVTLLAATVVGDAPITGRVVGMSLRSADNTPAKTMGLTLRVSTNDLEAIASRVRRG